VIVVSIIQDFPIRLWTLYM